MREALEKDFEAKRWARIKEVSHKMEMLFGEKIRQVQTGLAKSKDLSTLLKEIRPAVEKAFLGEGSGFEVLTRRLASMGENRLQKLRSIALMFLISIFSTYLGLSLGATYHQSIKQFFASVDAPDETTPEATSTARDLATTVLPTPTMDSTFKSTYVDNVVYTLHYLDIKEDATAQKEWINDLNRFFQKELHLDERVSTRFFNFENRLIKKLGEIRIELDASHAKDDLTRMRNAEDTVVPKLVSLVEGQANYTRVRELEANFYARVIEERKAASVAHPNKEGPEAP
jgi:hypothetical protein